MADPNQQPNWMTTLGQKVNPGVESLLSAVPAILGAYESARGVPIGAPLQALGNLGMQHAANRQATATEEGDVANRMALLRMRGLLPQADQPQFTDLLGRMSPKAQQSELSDIESQAMAEQKIKPGHGFGPNGEFYWIPNNDPSKAYRDPRFDKTGDALKGSAEALWLRANPGKTPMDYDNYKIQKQVDEYTKKLTIANKQRLEMASPMAAERLAGTYSQYDKMLPNQLPGYHNLVFVDRRTGRPVQLKTFGEYRANMDKYIPLDRATATNTIPTLLATRAEMLSYGNLAAKVLPPSTGSGMKDWVNQQWMRWGKMSFESPGKPDVAALRAAKTQLALQLQKLFTSSTRPMNLVEFNRIIGHPEKGDSMFTLNDIQSAIPDDSTRENSQVLIKRLGELMDLRLDGLGMEVPASTELLDKTFEMMKGEAPEVPGLFAPSPEGGGEPGAAATPDGEDSDTIHLE